MSYFTKIINRLRATQTSLKKRGGLLTIVAIGSGSIIILILGLLLLVPEKAGINGLNTLTEAVSYAHNMPELPPMDNTNMVRPDYGTFHRAHNAGYITKKWRALLASLRLSSTFTWSPLYCKSLIELTATRLKGYKVEKNIIYKITPTDKTQLIVFGDLSGAYHSLTRGLQKIQGLKLLDDSLKIIAPETYMVFMGDAISRSPYGMETLGLILRLMEMNPDRVVYMRGNHEDNKYWEAFGLKDQLDVRFGSDNSAEVVSLINNVFLRLPLGLYLAIPQEKNHFLRISHLSSAESSKLKEDHYAHFLEAPQNGILDRYEIDKTVTHNNKIVIDAAINSEKKRHTFQVSTGLRQLPPDGGAITWTLLSAPTLVNQKGLKFVDDAFVIITVGAQKEDWKITLYAQNAITKDGFKTSEFQFFTGAPYAAKQKISSPARSEKNIEKEAPATAKEEPALNPEPAPWVKPTTPLSDVLAPAMLRRAIKSYFIQRLVTPPAKKKPVLPVPPTGPEVLPPSLDSRPLEPIRGAKGMSLTIGTPVRNITTQVVSIPLTVSIDNTTDALEETTQTYTPTTQPTVMVDQYKREQTHQQEAMAVIEPALLGQK